MEVVWMAVGKIVCVCVFPLLYWRIWWKKIISWPLNVAIWENNSSYNCINNDAMTMKKREKEPRIKYTSMSA